MLIFFRALSIQIPTGNGFERLLRGDRDSLTELVEGEVLGGSARAEVKNQRS